MRREKSWEPSLSSTRSRQILNANSFIIHRGASRAIYLKDDEYIDPSQDDSSDGHLCLHSDVERLVGHGQWHYLVILQEGLNCDGDGVAVQEAKQHSGINDVIPFFSKACFQLLFYQSFSCRVYSTKMLINTEYTLCFIRKNSILKSLGNTRYTPTSVPPGGHNDLLDITSPLYTRVMLY